MAKTTKLNALFANRESVVREIYGRLAASLATLGPFKEDPKRTSVVRNNCSPAHIPRRLGWT